MDVEDSEMLESTIVVRSRDYTQVSKTGVYTKGNLVFYAMFWSYKHAVTTA